MKQVMRCATLISFILVLSSLYQAEGYYESSYNDTLRTCREYPLNSTLSVKVPSNIIQVHLAAGDPLGGIFKVI